jgi:hypothetical protein
LGELYTDASKGTHDANGVRRSVAHVEYQTRPLDWIVDKLGVPRHTIDWAVLPQYRTHTWDGTPNPFATALTAIANWQNVGIESANGPGKTYLAACLTLWFIACFEGSQVVTAAPKERQLELHCWKEIGRLWPRFQAMFPGAELLKLHIRMDGRDDWGAVGFVAGVSASEVSAAAVKAQGFHAEHLLFILEELTGIASAVYNAFFNTCTAPHNLIWGQGNPDHQLDQLHRHSTQPGTVAVRISAYDHPNVVCNDPMIVPGACSRKSIADKIGLYGEGSRMEQSRNKGISPAESSEALIKLEWVNAAMARWERWMQEPSFQALTPALGVDVANSENGDKAALAFGRGPLLQQVTARQCPNANKLGDEVFDLYITAEKVDPMHVGVDNVGVGSGTVNTLDERTLDKSLGVVQRLSGGAIENTQHMPDGSTYEWAPDANLFDHLRSQMYWQLREDLRNGLIALPPSQTVRVQLITPTYTPDKGKVVVLPKKEIKKLLGGSPNEMDAIVYWNWVRRREALPVEPVKPARDDPPPPQPRQDEFRFTPAVYETDEGYYDQLPAGF